MADQQDHYRPAPQAHYQQSQQRSAQSQQRYAQSQQRYAQPQQRNQAPSYTRQQPRYMQPQPSAPRDESRQSVTTYRTDYHTSNYGRRDAYAGRQAWYWHGGVAWAPQPVYWGGGFWGNFEIGLPVASYTVQTQSPGAQLLANYGLTQGPCDQDNMVDIYGPDGSEICAYPNNMVAPGQYNVDPATLTLTN